MCKEGDGMQRRAGKRGGLEANGVVEEGRRHVL